MALDDGREITKNDVNKSKRRSVKIYEDCKILLDDMTYNSKRSNMDLMSLAILEYAQRHYSDSFEKWKHKKLPGQD
jgi:hypothetical protein